MGRLRRLTVPLALWLCAGHAWGQVDDPLGRARTHFEAGRALYQLGNYNEALREFGAGYELAPRPQFLLNLGQCYRKLNDLDKAREYYQRYLHEAPPTDPERAQAQQILVEIERSIAERDTAAASAAAPPPVVAATVVTPASAATLTARAAPPRRTWIKRNWWIVPVGAVVVGVGLGLGVYYGTRSSACDGANLACWDLSKP